MSFNWSPLWLSLRVAGVATGGALIPGVWLAYLLATQRFPGRKTAIAVLAVLLALPCLILASTLLRPELLWLAGVVGATPLIAFGARAPLESLDRDYGNAARSLGVSEWRIFSHVMLPLGWRPMLAAAGIAFVRVLAEWSIVASL